VIEDIEDEFELSQLGREERKRAIQTQIEALQAQLKEIEAERSSSETISQGKKEDSTGFRDDPYVHSTETIKSSSKILEMGHIYFFYRPKLAVDHPRDLSQVQSLFFLLKPNPTSSPHQFNHSPNTQPFYRLIRIGKKKLPEKSHRFWGLVEEATYDPSHIRQFLEPETYGTITRGDRTRGACRMLGQGIYALVMRQDATHLAYVLQTPNEPGDAQKAFNIQKESSLFVVAKNPEMKDSSPGLPSSPTPVHYPPDLRAIFGHKRFAAVNPPQLMDFNGAELIFVGEACDIEADFGEAGKILEEELHDLGERKLVDTILFDELRMKTDQVVLEPLLEGGWR
jgi:prefoldin subunit 5